MWFHMSEHYDYVFCLLVDSVVHLIVKCVGLTSDAEKLSLLMYQIFKFCYDI